jgi:hypothetical protein
MLFFPTETAFSLSSSTYNSIIILSILNIQKKCSKHKTHVWNKTKAQNLYWVEIIRTIRSCIWFITLSVRMMRRNKCAARGVWWWPVTVAQRRAKPRCPQRCRLGPGPTLTWGFCISLGGSLPKLTSFEAEDCGASPVISSPAGTWGSSCDINNNYSNQDLLLRQQQNGLCWRLWFVTNESHSIIRGHILTWVVSL